MTRIQAVLGVIIVSLALAATPSIGAPSGTSVPQAGDWEGIGPDGLPLSFNLAHRGGHLVATSMAIGYPASCPAVARDAEAVPVDHPAYAGPGAGQSNGSSTAMLSGRIRRSTQPVVLRGAFSGPRTGTFSVQIQQHVGCGWPDQTLTWTVRRSNRAQVGDGTWTGPLTAPGLINANVRLVVDEQGRVVDSFTTFFTCLTAAAQGNTNFRAVPAFEFIRSDGSFSSPLDGGRVKGRPTTWHGRFLPNGSLTGTLTIFDDCTNHLIRARFSGSRTKAA